jgi:hypothetical protein
MKMIEKTKLTDKQIEMLTKQVSTFGHWSLMFSKLNSLIPSTFLQGAKPGFWIKMLKEAELTKEQAEMLKGEVSFLG